MGWNNVYGKNFYSDLNNAKFYFAHSYYVECKEEYIYAYIRYSILNGRLGVQEYVVNRARKDKSSLLRNAKIRLSNIHPGRLLMNLRGQNKLIK